MAIYEGNLKQIKIFSFCDHETIKLKNNKNIGVRNTVLRCLNVIFRFIVTRTGIFILLTYKVVLQF